MSQFEISPSSSGPVPPTVATSYVTNSGTAVPALNVLNVFGSSTIANNINGIATTGSGNTVTANLTNRLQGSATTTNATTADLFTFPMGASPGTFIFVVNSVAFNASLPAGAGYGTYTTIMTDGATATIIGDTDAFVHESAQLGSSEAQFVVSGNNAIFRVTGVGGLVIDWQVVGTYTQVN